MDLSLSALWENWYRFLSGKTRTAELESFIYGLEENLFSLQHDLLSGAYRHGDYRFFLVSDNKRRQIAVASIRDRIVHRLLYEYLVGIFDATFIFDAWSCRKNKGLLAAIERTQEFLQEHPHSFVWRSDIKKFFNNVDQNILLRILFRKISDNQARKLLQEIIFSYDSGVMGRGLPIGNLTSQIFANIYLNELDRYVKYNIKPLVYLRYGDDFIILFTKYTDLEINKTKIIEFIYTNLRLAINPRNDIIIKARRGLKFLGVIVYPTGRTLNSRNLKRIAKDLSLANAASYSGLIKKHCLKKIRQLNWRLLYNILERIP